MLIPITQFALDFDPIKAGVFGYSIRSWRGVNYDRIIYEEHPKLHCIIQAHTKNTALPELKDYFNSFYKKNADEITQSKNRLEKQLRTSLKEISGLVDEMITESRTPHSILILGVSALPPQVAHANGKRIDLYYKTKDFRPYLLHELLHLSLANQLRIKGEFEQRMKKPDKLRYYIESKTDQLLASHHSELAQRARAGYTFTDEDWNRGAA